jgi:hypothetical protein
MKTLEASRWWTKAGVSLLERVAKATQRHGVAEGLYYYACCTLATNKFCTSCPSGYHRYEWLCCYGAGHRVWGCVECTKGSSCWYGPFVCSYYYPTQYNC